MLDDIDRDFFRALKFYEDTMPEESEQSKKIRSHLGEKMHYHRAKSIKTSIEWLKASINIEKKNDKPIQIY